MRGAAPERVRKTLGGAAKKNNFARAAIAHLAQPFGELRRRVMFSRVIKQDDRCGGIESEFAEGRLRKDAGESSRNSVISIAVKRAMRVT